MPSPFRNTAFAGMGLWININIVLCVEKRFGFLTILTFLISVLVLDETKSKMRLQLRQRIRPSHVNPLKMKFNYQGPRRLGARGCRSATQESLRSTELGHQLIHERCDESNGLSKG